MKGWPMNADQILSQAPRVLSQHHREQYFDQGYTCVEGFVPVDTLQELVDVTGKLVDASRTHSESGSVYDLGPIHNAETPQLRRLKRPDDQHEVYWNFAKGLRCINMKNNIIFFAQFSNFFLLAELFQFHY